MEIEKLFIDIESCNPQECEKSKKALTEFFNQTKEEWVVKEMMDYYLRTNSIRIIDVLVKVQQPHYSYIFDRLSEWLKKEKVHIRVQALTLFGFIVRKHPTWLVQVANKKLIKDILKLLVNEKEIVPLMSALLCIITLLPIIPSLVPQFLTDLFGVFGHLASWNCQNPNSLSDDQLIHLQLGLHMLFHRLYGMYPANFLSYLREFICKEKGPIFQHTIKPLLETVRVHPMLVTSTKDSELSSTRWKEIEPHDVVVECAKFSLAVFHQDHTIDCFPNTRLLRQNLPISRQIDSIQSLSAETLKSCDRLSSPFQSLMDSEKSFDYQKLDALWSPHTEILATPPPTVTLSHTPTQFYGLPPSSNASGSNSLLLVSGSSPPEAAVEATPETTPMKDLNSRRTTSNPHAVRALLGASQPSSPMRREQSPFNFPSSGNSITLERTTTSQRIVQMLNDRNQSTMQMLSNRPNISSDNQNVTNPTLLMEQPSSSNATTFPNTPTNFDITQEDQEVHQLTSQKHANDKVHSSSQCVDCDETEQSPCSAGGLHVPTSSSIRLLASGIKRYRMVSCCQNYSSSYKTCGTSEKHSPLFPNSKVRRTKSCPSISKYLLEESNASGEKTEKNVIQFDTLQPNGFGKHRNFDNFQLKKNTEIIKAKVIVKANKNLPQCSSKTSCGTQTIQSLPPVYEYSLFELFAEDTKLRFSSESCEMRPQKILSEFIERTIKTKRCDDAGLRLEYMEEQLQLLNLQLQYERYRREIHAERNRRLMGRSREKRSLEMENDRLHDQLRRSKEENQTVFCQLRNVTKNSTDREHKYLEEIKIWKTKYQHESDENKLLRATNENLQKRLNDEIKIKKNTNYEIEELRGEIFDLRNELQNSQFQASLGIQCKQELTKLEMDLMVIGEVQIKCRDKLLGNISLAAKEEQLQRLQETSNAEIMDLKATLEEKSSQLDGAKYRLNELQSQFVNKEILCTDQKRLLKVVKDEYEEKFKALNKKYDVQKAIILQMEQKILEFQKNLPAQNSVVLSPESDKTDFPSSMDRTSPLSTSLASSEGLSSSLRSITELRNLQALVVQSTTSSVLASAAGLNSTSQRTPPDIAPIGCPPTPRRSSISSNINHPALLLPTTIARSSNVSSLDIPVPRTSQQPYHQTKSHHFSQNR